MKPDYGVAVKVGIFFTIAVLIALGLSLQVGRSSWFSKQYTLEARFVRAPSVEAGTKVTLRGFPVGTVGSLDWEPATSRIRAVLNIKSQYEIPSNAVARVQSSSFLGGSVIDIALDPEQTVGPALADGGEITTREVPGIEEVLSTVGDLSRDTQELIQNLNSNHETTLAKVNEVIEENREYIRATSESFSKAGPKLELLSDRLNEMTEFMKSGEGTIGALYANKDLYDQMVQVSEDAKEITAQIKSGSGDLGALIYGDQLAADAKKVMADLQSAATEVQGAVSENRESMKSLFASLSDAGPRIDKAISNFNEVSEKINAGEGTLGKLVNDPSLYNDAKSTMNQVGESFENSEEQGVFRSFLGLLFGALI